MQRVTITIDDDLDAEFERFMRRAAMATVRGDPGPRPRRPASGGHGDQWTAPVRGGLVYIYDHEARELPKRLTRDFHTSATISLEATLHVHLDEDSCMEVTVLKGRGSDVQHFADHIIAQRGVRHGHVVYLPLQKTHSHAQTANRIRSSGHRH